MFLLALPLNTTVHASSVQRVPVLLYHHILGESEFSGDNASIVRTEDFRRQMQFLYDNGYRTVTENAMHRFLFKKERLPDKSFMIHFDDGYYSNITNAYPILKEFGFKATIFLITGFTTEDDKGLNMDSYLSKKCIEATRDVFTFASHTHAMHNFKDGVTILEQSRRLEIVRDMRRSFKIATNTFSFAYPHGRRNQNTILTLKQLGIEMAYTIDRGYITQNSDPFALSRYIVFRETKLSDLSRFVADAQE
jgi:peptidoglycan/xylan/chitin deacetylase (PgdA/CDA1 family)